MKVISIRGARTHNLKNISLDIPRDQLIVLTGISGSGKSSLAFDTIYADGQRRYVESLSAYARQFLSMMEKPDVDHIEGLSPAISIEQKTTSHNPRSTVGTVTEIYDYLRLLFARVGQPHCPQHGTVLAAQTISQMVDTVFEHYPEDKRLMLLAPVAKNRKGEYVQQIEQLRASGFTRLRINQQVVDLDQEQAPKLDLYKKHTIEVVVDRFKVRNDKDRATRLAESFEIALRLADGVAVVAELPSDKAGNKTSNKADEEQVFSSRYACHECGYSLTELEPRLFSFNNPNGACADCDGLGQVQYFDPEQMIQDPTLSLLGGAIKGWDKRNAYYFQLLQSLARHYQFDLNTPFEKLPKKITEILLYGSGEETIQFEYLYHGRKNILREHTFEGIIPNLERRYADSTSPVIRVELAKCRSQKPCLSCKGSRLNESARHVLIKQHNLPKVAAMTIKEAREFLAALSLTGAKAQIAEKILKEVNDRLTFLINVGLDYLTLDRGAETLSGGEAQRIRLASQIGAGLVGVMYVLDEPSIGLHQRDNQRLLKTLFHLRDLGNTVIVVEHDEEAIRAADHVIDIGPGAGVHGGCIVASGTAKDIAEVKESLTGQYLSRQKMIAVPKRRVTYKPDRVIQLKGATANNLKQVNVTLPIGLMTCVTGVSGSGKSTLINDTFYPIAARELNRARMTPAAYKSITGLTELDKVVNIDQSPIGRTPRSNPATYTGLFTPIRELYAQTQEARSRGYRPGRFSFNVKGGRCEACQGDGLVKVEMHFLPDVYVPCDICKGHRYNRETLEVCYKGKNIHETLTMSVEQAYEFFNAIPGIANKLRTLMDVGLSYITLGQNATTLSGGEAQRIKLSKELSKRDTGKTLYILDEPTTGLHFADIQQLLNILQRLRDHGNTIIVIEHNLDVIKTADWIVDLGPEGGAGGGEVIATGTPEQVAKIKHSYTGQCLKPLLKPKIRNTSLQ